MFRGDHVVQRSTRQTQLSRITGSQDGPLELLHLQLHLHSSALLLQLLQPPLKLTHLLLYEHNTSFNLQPITKSWTATHTSYSSNKLICICYALNNHISAMIIYLCSPESSVFSLTASPVFEVESESCLIPDRHSLHHFACLKTCVYNHPHD